MRLIAPITTLSRADIHSILEQRRADGRVVTFDAPERDHVLGYADWRDCYDSRY